MQKTFEKKCRGTGKLLTLLFIGLLSLTFVLYSSSTSHPSLGSTSLALTKDVLSGEKLKSDKQYGDSVVLPFSSSWLADYPAVLEHVESEHILHVKGLDGEGEGLTWHTEKFATDMEPRLNPEAKVKSSRRSGIQMKLGYFIVPEKKMKVMQAATLDENLLQGMLESWGGKKAYRFYVHPEAYDHFRSLHDDPEIGYVPPEESGVMGTPTSSYRSWVLRPVTKDNRGEWAPVAGSVPFVLKMGVAGSVLGFDRWLTPNEIERSVIMQQALDQMPDTHFRNVGEKGADFYVLKENLGLMLRDIQGYPPSEEGEGEQAKESGLIIREFPQDVLEGNRKLISFAALMSPERVKSENWGAGQSSSDEEGATAELPLIYKAVAAAIAAGEVESPFEFVQKYLIDGYLASTEPLVFHEGIRLESHSQNLLMVLDNNFIPTGFAYRDFGGMWVDVANRALQGRDVSLFYPPQADSQKLFKSKGAVAKGYIAAYSWFYRYQIIVKLLNTMTTPLDGAEMIPPPKGAPYQLGQAERVPERLLRNYIVEKVHDESANPASTLKALEVYSLSWEEYGKVLDQLDNAYLRLLDKYFELEKISIELEDGAFPSAELGAEKDDVLFHHKGFLGKHRQKHLDPGAERYPISKLPTPHLAVVQREAITAFETIPFVQSGAIEFSLESRGACFYSETGEIVAVMPYTPDFRKENLLQALE